MTRWKNTLLRTSLITIALLLLALSVFAHEGEAAHPIAGLVSWGFLFFGLMVIAVVGFILFTSKVTNRSAEKFKSQTGVAGYIARMQMFSYNARLYMIHVVGMDVIHGTWEVVFNLYLLTIGFDPAFIGVRVLLRAASSAFMSIPAGLISDRIGRKMSFILGDGVGAAMSLIAISTENPTLILGAAVVAGAFGSLHGVSEPAFMAENSEDYERVHLFSVADGTRTAASVIGSVLAGLLPLLILADNPEALIMTYRIVAYIGIIIWFASLIPAVLLKTKGATAEGALTLRTMFSNIKHPDRIFKLSLPSALIALGAGFTLPLMNVYFYEGLGREEIEIGAIFAGGSALLVVASFMAPFIAQRLGKVRAVVTMQAVSVPFIFLLGYADQLGDVLGSVVMVAVIAYVARITTMDVTGPIREAFGMEILDPGERGTQVGIQRALAGMLYGVAAYLGGQMMSTGDYHTPFLIMAGFYIVSIALFWFFFGGKQKFTAPSVELSGQGTD